MKVEIVGFYKNIDPNIKIEGTLHAYLVDYDIDIRGIVVMKREKGYFYKMPGRKTLDPETKEKVWYPHISFSNIEKTQDMIKSIKKEADEFLKKELTTSK